MISQSDIIRTLVNKNCTDESVMTTALSPDCTPPKLLEKLTEAERFDLALDVSMKLGLDVIPLWRTWAMRCIQNYNFRDAREKFRHCFVRFRSNGGRTNPSYNQLLADIIKQLSKMTDTKMSLLDEIELIKQRKLDSCNARESMKSIIFKTNIYNECCYYLNEYGTEVDWITFFVKNSLWDKAIDALLSEEYLSHHSEDDKFFISEIFLYSTSRGHLEDLLKSFRDRDQSYTQSFRYFKVMYNFCLRNRRYNLLYYIQSSTKDYIAAANTQIIHFFLKRPVLDYHELNHRISSLTKASENFQLYLDREVETDLNKATHRAIMSTTEVNRLLSTIEMQIDITRNFSINEVSGCIGTLKLEDDESSTNRKLHNDINDEYPVTLFDTDKKRKTFLAALVLIYYDVSCSSYFSKSGLDMTNKLIEDHELDKVEIFKTAMRIIIDDDSCDIIENSSLLLERIKEDYATNYYKQKSISIKLREKQKYQQQQQQQQSGLVTKVNRSSNNKPKTKRSQASDKPTKTGADKSAQNNLSNVKADDEQEIARGARAICDEVVRDSIGSCSEPDYKMELAKLLSVEAKIELYIAHGKLSNAQRLACAMNRPDYVSSIIEAATKLNQNHVKTVCQLWLAKHELAHVDK